MVTLFRRKCASTRKALYLGAGLAVLAVASPASADYIGPSYLKVPGVQGDSFKGKYNHWVRAEANYWSERPGRREIRGISGKESGLKFTGPRAPANGASMLALAVGKNSPGLTRLMELCRSGEKLPELVYAESSDLTRHPQENGPRPGDVPDYYEYSLKNVRLTCPVAEGAPEQAFGVHFDSIEWLNAAPQPKPRPLTTTPARLAAAPRKGATKTFIVTWFAPIADSSEDQCPQLNRKPTQDEYFALMSPERARAQRAALASKGGADTTALPYRGPGEMNVILLPGIVADPGHVSPQTDIVRGFNLDGKDSAANPAHKNYVSPDGRKGIDNQLFSIQGCIAGWRRNGFLPMIGNELRRAGGLSILVEVSGIDDERNDKDVAVTILYSADPMRRDGSSKTVLPDFTFRVNDNPEFSQDFARFRGRIVDGVIMTDALEHKIDLHEGPASTWSLANARMRLEFTPEGELRATLGGYRDWRQLLSTAFFQASDYENTIGFNAPGMYNAVRRAADGLKDPVTGELTGISAAYEMEGIPAFIPPAQQKQLAAGGAFGPASRK